MMNRYVLCLLLGSSAFSSFGQHTADYYQLPDRHTQYNRLLTRYGGAQIRDRWYVAVDGFLRTDHARLDNTFGGLIGTSPVAKVGWSALIGWSYRERWAVEGGYGYVLIHTHLLLNGRPPLAFTYANEKQGTVLRVKRMILSTSGPWRRSGFWLSGGLWAIPNTGVSRRPLSLVGYNHHAYHEAGDTLRLMANTQTNTHLTGLAEIGLEYNIRLGSHIDLGVAARRYWGLGTTLTTDVSYAVNRQIPQNARLEANGAGMSYGLTLRYTCATRRTQPNVLNLRGNRRLGK